MRANEHARRFALRKFRPPQPPAPHDDGSCSGSKAGGGWMGTAAGGLWWDCMVGLRLRGAAPRVRRFGRGFTQAARGVSAPMDTRVGFGAPQGSDTRCDQAGLSSSLLLVGARSAPAYQRRISPRGEVGLNAVHLRDRGPGPGEVVVSCSRRAPLRARSIRTRRGVRRLVSATQNRTQYAEDAQRCAPPRPWPSSVHLRAAS